MWPKESNPVTGDEFQGEHLMISDWLHSCDLREREIVQVARGQVSYLKENAPKSAAMRLGA
jgi:hypothetical protein